MPISKALNEVLIGPRTLAGVIRSLVCYYGGRKRHCAMDLLYGRFLRPGDLAFDIGSHVGDRIASFRRLGATVVAVEPQPALFRVLRLLYGHDPSVAIEAAAVGARHGDIELFVNLANPTVSTASGAFVAAAREAANWEGQFWDHRIRVAQTTLDEMIERHGMPVFIKIDIEGFERQALEGLTHPVRALSFEFTTIQRQVAHDCLNACTRLGDYRFNAALGESQRLVHERWVSAGEIGDWLDGLPHEANSGDIYAALVEESVTDVGPRTR